MIDVSIIIPTYNRLWSLPIALQSCRASSLEIEIIIVDDGSTDGTRAWLAEQSGIQIICQQNAGKDWAVNKGFAQATGKYIRFLDSDDWLLPGSTDSLFEEAERAGADVVCAGYQVYEGEKLVKEISWADCDDFLARQLGEGDASHYSAYLFRREFIVDVPHRQEFGALDDRKFIIEIALKFPAVSQINLPTLAHRIHDRERLQKPSNLQETADHLARYKIYKSAFGRLEVLGELTQRRKKAACDILWHLAHWVAKTHPVEGCEIYNWVYKLDPAFVPRENLFLHRLYAALGFVQTERMLRFRRLLKF
ncbi:glycosyltransferase family 2 protein [Mucilaginibacter sp.]|uniref:glycosyltransferase family 2 protein n=1 Tax=Mucilaginibacter sp. TaxID=1882438 RepID=UPI0035BC2C08